MIHTNEGEHMKKQAMAEMIATEWNRMSKSEKLLKACELVAKIETGRMKVSESERQLFLAWMAIAAEQVRGAK